MWVYYAILSAIFAALTAIFAKIGLQNMNSNLALAIRTCIILLITWGIVFASGGIDGIKSLTKQNWLFLVLSGVATGLSWLFYFRALQYGEVARVAAVDKLSVVFTILLAFLILREPFSWRVVLGGCLIVGGTLVIMFDR